LRFSAKQQREITKFWIFSERELRRLIYSIFLNAIEQVFKPIDVLNRSKYLRNSNGELNNIQTHPNVKAGRLGRIVQSPIRLTQF